VLNLGDLCEFEMLHAFVACQQEDGRILENVDAAIEEGCVEEAASKADESVINSSCSGSIYQMVTNADGSVSLVGLDTTQLDQLLHIQG